MKTLLRLGVLLLLCGSAWGAISFHASSTDGNPNGGNVTITLPTVSNNDYVLCAVESRGPATIGTTTLPPYTVPSTWTALVNVAGQEVIGRKWQTGDATTVVFVQQNGAASWEAAACVSYTGVDTSTPIDGAANWTVKYAVTSMKARAPSVSPAFTNDQLLVFYWSDNLGGGSFPTPSGLTSRVTSAPGPAVGIFDEALSTGAATGNFDSAATGCDTICTGAQVLLKAASGGSPATTAVQPTMGGIAASATCASDFNVLYPSNGDLFVVVTMGAGAATTISGFAKVFQTADVGLFTKTWTSGTSTNYGLTGGGNINSGCEAILVRNYNPTGVTIVTPTVDASGTTTGSVITSLASSSIAANSASDLLLAFWSAGDNTVNNSNAWTLDAGLEKDAVYTLNVGTETYAEGILQAPSNPTGTFTSTIAAAARAGAGAVTFKIATGVTRKRGQVIQVN